MVFGWFPSKKKMSPRISENSPVLVKPRKPGHQLGRGAGHRAWAWVGWAGWAAWAEASRVQLAGLSSRHVGFFV